MKILAILESDLYKLLVFEKLKEINPMRRLISSVIAVTIAVTLAIPTTHAAELEEIIVTATKKEESLQDVSISVSVISGEDIQNSEAEKCLYFHIDNQLKELGVVFYKVRTIKQKVLFFCCSSRTALLV